jgi:O-antigen ligase
MDSRHSAPPRLGYKAGFSASSVLILLWMAIPLLGKPTAVLFIILMPLLRDRAGTRLAALKGFAVLCWIYAAYISVRDVIEGHNVTEVLLDVIPLVTVATFAALFIRSPIQLIIHRIFKTGTVLLLIVFGLALLERAILGSWRPQLLLGNPLNLSFALLMPLILVSMDRYAPSSLWAWLGVLAFGLGAYVIGGLSQSRGLFVGFGVLLLVRVGFCLFEGNALRNRLLTAARLLVMGGLVAVTVTVNPMISNRYSLMSATVLDENAPEEWSTGLRLAMLRGGLEAVAEKPLFGHGPRFRTEAAFNHIGAKYQYDLTHLHNDYLTHMVAGGVPALLLLLALILYPVFVGMRGNRKLGRSHRHARLEIAVLCTLTLAGVAAVNNLLFVDVSAFITAMTVVASILLLEFHRSPESPNRA